MGRTRKAHGGGTKGKICVRSRPRRGKPRSTSVSTLRDRNRELLKAIKRLRQSQKAIIQKERLHALGQMASGIVHDFNNALTPILGASDFLISNPEILKNWDEAMTLLQSIRTAGRDAKSMVRRLRGFYRPEEDAEVSAIDINPLVEQSVLLTQPKWGMQAPARGQKINMEVLLGKIPLVCIDESHVREVLTNVILNAVDAMPAGGTIAIRTHSDKKWVYIDVSDTGTGMPDEVKEHCFEPFFSTKGKDGTGMGLAVVYGIIRKYGGKIKILSEVNRGTTFKFFLPVCKGRRKQESHEPDHIGASEKKLRVLLVDDDLPSREIVARCLESDKHVVVTARVSQEALDKCETGEFDIVFMDVVMPEINGLNLVARLKEKIPKLLAVLMTGSIETARDGRMPEGVDLILEKPITQMDLRRAIAAVLVKSS